MTEPEPAFTTNSLVFQTITPQITIGLSYLHLQQYDKAISDLEPGMESSQALGLPDTVTRCLQNLGDVDRERGDDTTAMDYYEQSLTLAKKFKINIVTSQTLLEMADVKLRQHKWQDAKDLLLESITIKRRNQRLPPPGSKRHAPNSRTEPIFRIKLPPSLRLENMYNLPRESSG